MNINYEYDTVADLLDNLHKSRLNLVDFIIDREIKLYGVSAEQIRTKLVSYLETMSAAVVSGLKLTKPLICLNREARKMLKNKSRFMNELEYEILYSAVAIAEYNCSMGKIVACPTAGSCGILPGVLLPVSKKYGFSKKLLVNGLIIAGEIGRITAAHTSISGAVGGCMVECGIGSAMTAAAVAYLFDCAPAAIFNAAALALKNNLGLICDPVAGLVEVPCVKRNGFKAIKAFAAAQMAVAGISSAVPFDDVVSAMKEVADNMPKIYKKTSEDGLAATPSGLKFKRNLLKKKR